MERPLSAKLSSARLAASAFVAAFLIILFPFAESMILHYPDERHYSQGGVLMLETGDYLTPRTGEETVRLKKPPFAYWMSVAGMTIFGIGALGSRFFWLIAAFGVLTLTYRLALKVSGNERIALFSLAILGSNFVFLRASVNAIPDMPLTLFIMVALNGFAGLLFGERENRFDAWLAYLGTSFAILTKGIPHLARSAAP